MSTDKGIRAILYLALEMFQKQCGYLKQGMNYALSTPFFHKKPSKNPLSHKFALNIHSIKDNNSCKNSKIHETAFAIKISTIIFCSI